MQSPETLAYNRNVQDQRTVMRLRLGVGIIGVLLPVVLSLGNWVYAELRHQSLARVWPASMSSSYYTSTRNVFVGSLCALGVFLIGYRATARTALWSTITGMCAIAVALCPTAPSHPTHYESIVGAIHLVLAGGLLVALAMFSIFSFRDPKADRQSPAVQWGYLIAGLLILTLLAAAIVTGLTHIGDGWTVTPLYLCEWGSVWAFGAAWIGAALELGADLDELSRSRRLLMLGGADRPGG